MKKCRCDEPWTVEWAMRKEEDHEITNYGMVQARPERKCQGKKCNKKFRSRIGAKYCSNCRIAHKNRYQKIV